MPAAKAPSIGWLASHPPDGASTRAIDWLRFGQLLRERLGWGGYPQWPRGPQ
jgi:hypothetical protein